MFEKRYAIGSVEHQIEGVTTEHRKIEICSQNTGCSAMVSDNVLPCLWEVKQRLTQKVFLLYQGFYQQSSRVSG